MEQIKYYLDEHIHSAVANFSAGRANIPDGDACGQPRQPRSQIQGSDKPHRKSSCLAAPAVLSVWMPRVRKLLDSLKRREHFQQELIAQTDRFRVVVFDGSI